MIWYSYVLINKLYIQDLFSPFGPNTDIFISIIFKKERGAWLPEMTTDLKTTGSQFYKFRSVHTGKHTYDTEHTVNDNRNQISAFKRSVSAGDAALGTRMVSTDDNTHALGTS